VSTVLLAEDDAGIADPLARALEREGYDVVQVDDGAEALRLANRLPVSVVVLDLGLPSLDGVDVCRTLREQGKDVPVLMLTARTEEIDIVVGLDAGADDYVAKPFRLNEVLARVRALMRRSPPDRLEVGPIVLDTGARRVSVNGADVTLSFKEFELLRLLMSHTGDVVPRERIMAEVWPDLESPGSKTLDMHMSWLRRKLIDAGDERGDARIATIRGMGFRLNGDESA
jgi:DNA-binding response OmpR family regulator